MMIGFDVLVGIPEPIPRSASLLVMQFRRRTGSFIGCIRETQEMLNFLSSKMISTLWIFAMLVLKMIVMDRFFFSVDK